MSQDNDRSMRDVLERPRVHQRGQVMGRSTVSQLCAQGVDGKANQLVEDQGIVVTNAFLSMLRARLTDTSRHEGLKINCIQHNGGLLFFKPSTLEAKRCVSVAHYSNPSRLVTWFAGTNTIDTAFENFHHPSVEGALSKLATGERFETPANITATHDDLQKLAELLIEYLA